MADCIKFTWKFIPVLIVMCVIFLHFIGNEIRSNRSEPILTSMVSCYLFTAVPINSKL